MKRAKIAAIFALILVLAAPSAAEDFTAGAAAHARGDYAAALGEFRPLAEGGDVEAQFMLGYMYARGQGVAHDFAAAMMLYRMAAVQGHAQAQSNLGVLYRLGMGSPDGYYAEAAKWYRRAAAEGGVQAKFELGVLYLTGQGVAQDDVLAHMWFNLAAGQGDNAARKNRDAVAARMTPGQIAEAETLAGEWQPALP